MPHCGEVASYLAVFISRFILAFLLTFLSFQITPSSSCATCAPNPITHCLHMCLITSCIEIVCESRLTGSLVLLEDKGLFVYANFCCQSWISLMILGVILSLSLAFSVPGPDLLSSLYLALLSQFRYARIVIA